MNILVFGGSGFLGTEFIHQAIKEDHTLRIFVHHSPIKRSYESNSNVEMFYGDILKYNDLAKALKNIDIVINFVGIIKEHPPQTTFEKTHIQVVKAIVEAMQKSGVKKLYQISALGVNKGSNIPYFKTKYEAENIIKTSDLEWTIFRPSLIWGHEGFSKEIDRITNIPIFSPIIGSGKYLFQPIRIEDVISIILLSLNNNKLKYSVLDLVGPTVYSFEELVYKSESIKGIKKMHINIPLFLLKLIAIIADKIKFPFPITLDQIKMLEIDNTSIKLAEIKSLNFTVSNIFDK